MTVAEYTALIILTRACTDRAVLRRALALVPDLAEVVDIVLEPRSDNVVRLPIVKRDGR